MADVRPLIRMGMPLVLAALIAEPETIGILALTALLEPLGAPPVRAVWEIWRWLSGHGGDRGAVPPGG